MVIVRKHLAAPKILRTYLEEIASTPMALRSQRHRPHTTSYKTAGKIGDLSLINWFLICILTDLYCVSRVFDAFGGV